MEESVIQVANIGKRFRIGLEEIRHDTLVSKFLHYLLKPVENLKRLKSLTSFGKGIEDAKDIIWALRNVSFEVKKGEKLGLIGLNGTGKSTLLKILSSITSPTEGKIMIKGRVASLLEVGTGFHPELTGRENTYLNGTILGMTKKEIDAKFDQIVSFSEVEKFIDTPVKRYSSGMRVRLGFAVAAHLDPDILLVDEVLAVGDINFQKKCLGKMDDVSKEGRTVIFVSHNMEMIQKLCSRCILLDAGKIKVNGKTQDVIQEYFNQGIFREQSGDSLLEYKRYKHYGADFKFSKCRIYNSLGQKNSTILLGEPFTLVIEGISYTHLENLDISVIIQTTDRMVITTINTSDNDIYFNVPKGNTLKFSLKINDIILNTGKYVISLSAIKNGVGVDIVSYATKLVASDLVHKVSDNFKPREGLVRYRSEVIQKEIKQSQTTVQAIK